MTADGRGGAAAGLRKNCIWRVGIPPILCVSFVERKFFVVQAHL